MRYVLIVLGILLVAALGIVLIGWRLPLKHVATKSVELSASPESVFALISTPENYAAWRGDVKKVDVTTENGVTRFREDGSNGPILFEITEKAPPRRFVTTIAPSSGFDGARPCDPFTSVATVGITSSRLRNPSLRLASVVAILSFGSFSAGSRNSSTGS